MQAHGLPVPEIEFTQQDYSEPSEPFIVMPKFSDYTLRDLCEIDPQAAVRAFEKSGRFIPDLHERFAEAFKPFLVLEELQGLLAVQQERIDQVLDGKSDLAPIWEKYPILAQQIEDRFATFSRPITKRLAHGALHARNILATQGGEICVIDFGESIGMSSSLKDLSALLKGTDNPEQVEAILKGYGGVDEVDIQELRYWEFCSSVHDMRGHMVVYPDAEFTQELIERVRTIIEEGSLLPPL